MKNVKLHKTDFVIQAHITASCNTNCSMCYMKKAKTYKDEIFGELSAEDWEKIFFDLKKFGKNYDIPVRVYLTGGDPLLYKELDKLLSILNELKISIRMMGNPDTLTKDNIKKLKKYNVERFQLSLDGAHPETHDSIRGKKGHWKQVKEKVQLLNKYGIQSSLMSTISNVNANELVDMMRLACEWNVFIYNFARLTPFVQSDKKYMLSPDEYRKILISVDKEMKKQKSLGCKTILGKKDNLWILLMYEQGELKNLPEDNIVYSGCPIGVTGLSVLANGLVYSCRRLPVSIGKLPEDDLEKLFFDSKFHDKFRKINKFEKCKDCELLRFCRGCPAIAYASTGSIFGIDPQCWKNN